MYSYILLIIGTIFLFESCSSPIDFEEISNERIIKNEQSIHLSYIVSNYKNQQRFETSIDSEACKIISLYNNYNTVLITFYRKSWFTNIERLDKNTDNIVESMNHDYLWTYHFRKGEFRFKMNDSKTNFRIRNKTNICE